MGSNAPGEGSGGGRVPVLADLDDLGRYVGGGGGGGRIAVLGIETSSS